MEFLLYLVIAYVWGSFTEWYVHKNLMHGRSLRFPSIPRDHATHHKAYYAQFVGADDSDDKNLSLCLEHILIGLSPVLVVSLLVNIKFCLFLLGFGLLYFYLFDRLHSAQHLEASFIPGPWKRAMVFHHFLHHQHPQRNFGIVLPLADWVMGTVATPTFADKRKWVTVKNCMEYMEKTGVTLSDKTDEAGSKCFLHPNTLKYMENGYIGPAPSPEYSDIGYRILQIIKFLFVGDIKVEGIQNLPEGSYILACSHDSWKDLFIIRYVVGDIRVAAAQSVMKFCLLGTIMGPFLGCYPVAGDGKGTAVKSSIKALQEGVRVGICPSGWCDLNKKPRPFKNGVIRMARGAQVPIVPVFIDYLAPAEPDWFCKLPLPAQIFFNALNPRQRKGVRVIIGEAIEEFPGNTLEATQFLEYKVNKLRGIFG